MARHLPTPPLLRGPLLVPSLPFSHDRAYGTPTVHRPTQDPRAKKTKKGRIWECKGADCQCNDKANEAAALFGQSGGEGGALLPAHVTSFLETDESIYSTYDAENGAAAGMSWLPLTFCMVAVSATLVTLSIVHRRQKAKRAEINRIANGSSGGKGGAPLTEDAPLMSPAATDDFGIPRAGASYSDLRTQP